jgi:hypothetical protein
MAVRTPTPELIDAIHRDFEPHESHDPHVRHLIPGWGWALMWGAAIVTVVAIIWRISED